MIFQQGSVTVVYVSTETNFLLLGNRKVKFVILLSDIALTGIHTLCYSHSFKILVTYLCFLLFRIAFRIACLIHLIFSD